MAKEMVIDGIIYRLPEPGNLLDAIFGEDDCYHRPIFELIEDSPISGGWTPNQARMDCRYTADERIWLDDGDVVFVETGEHAE